MQATDDDNIGAFFKQKFEALSDQPEQEVKDSLFEKMDMLEGKRSKTIYLHVNVMGMKVAASLTMLVVSSLAIMAVAAVTVIAVRNNTRKKEIPATIVLPEAPQHSISPANPQEVPSQPLAPEPTAPAVGPIEEAQPQEQPDQTILPPEEKMTPTPDALPPATSPKTAPLQKNGNNKELLKEVEDEEQLFKK